MYVRYNWYGERLDLDHALYVCLANARTPEERKAQREQAQAGEPELFRPRTGAVELSDAIRCIEERLAAAAGRPDGNVIGRC